MIDVVNQHRKLRANKRMIIKAIRTTFHTENKRYNMINVLLVSDRKIKELHSKFLNENSVTDVITFDLSITDGFISGDIIISLDTAFKQAKIYQVKFLNEVVRLAIHGTLHLCGYQDEDGESRRRMVEREEEILEKVFSNN